MTTIHPSSDTATTFPFTMAVYASEITCTASLFTSTNNGSTTDDATDLYTVSITSTSLQITIPSSPSNVTDTSSPSMTVALLSGVAIIG